MRKFTRKELARNDGKNGSPAYIACNGNVYDVSDSFLWKSGKHWVLHVAGQDLTDCLKDAPHGEDLLDRIPVIGILEDFDSQ